MPSPSSYDVDVCPSAAPPAPSASTSRFAAKPTAPMPPSSSPSALKPPASVSPVSTQRVPNPPISKPIAVQTPALKQTTPKPPVSNTAALKQPFTPMAPPTTAEPSVVSSAIAAAAKVQAACASITTIPTPSPHALRAALEKEATNIKDVDEEEQAPYKLTALKDALPDDIDEDGPVCGVAHKRYKIAMFAWESLHAIAVGGVAPHLTELAAGLERRGHEVHVYVRTGSGQQSYEMIDGVHVHRISFDLSSDFVQEVTNMCNAMVHFMLETERFMNTPFDICHAHDWLAAPALLNIKRNHERRCVFTVHSTEFGRCGNNVYGGQSARIRAIENEAIAVADKVIGVSGVLCDEIKGHYSFDWDKLRCVYNGINCLRYDGNLWDPAEVRSMYGVGPMDPMVLFVGRMATQKGPDILVEAIPSVLASRPDAKFVLVGDGYMKNGLVARVHNMGVAGSVCFTGKMSGQPLVDLFKATDIVAIPSRNEPFGIVTLEAWASNKPVIVTTSGGPREFVWHDNDGYLVDTSADGMAWGICNAFANFKHARYMGDRGRVKAAFQFSWDNIAENTNNIYDELLPDHPGHPDPNSEEQDVETEPVSKKKAAE